MQKTSILLYSVYVTVDFSNQYYECNKISNERRIFPKLNSEQNPE
jgi:hypothetical protein